MVDSAVLVLVVMEVVDWYVDIQRVHTNFMFIGTNLERKKYSVLSILEIKLTLTMIDQKSIISSPIALCPL